MSTKIRSKMRRFPRLIRKLVFPIECRARPSRRPRGATPKPTSCTPRATPDRPVRAFASRSSVSRRARLLCVTGSGPGQCANSVTVGRAQECDQPISDSAPTDQPAVLPAVLPVVLPVVLPLAPARRSRSSRAGWLAGSRQPVGRGPPILPVAARSRAHVEDGGGTGESSRVGGGTTVLAHPYRHPYPAPT